MGWIADRHMRQGGSIGGRRKGRAYPKDGAPLQVVLAVLERGRGPFEPDRVALACGHIGISWGGRRARCPACKP